MFSVVEYRNRVVTSFITVSCIHNQFPVTSDVVDGKVAAYQRD